MCGGTAQPDYTLSHTPGLSPRVRGNPPGMARRALAPGSIPACAGEPPLTDETGAPITVYPRVCGGTGISPAYRFRPNGLSPRVRGNLPGG